MPSNSLAKVTIENIESALAVYVALSAKAENELYEKVIKDMVKSDITHVGMLWWKEPITDQLYLAHISDAGALGVSGKLKIFRKYYSVMKYAPLYYMEGFLVVSNKYKGTRREITKLLGASDSNYLYLNAVHCEWVTNMLEIEDMVFELE